MIEYLIAGSVVWQNITDTNYHKFRQMMIRPNPYSDRGHVVFQQQVMALFGVPVSCDGDRFQRFCIWHEIHGSQYRKIEVTWNLRNNPPTVIGWDGSGDLPF